MGKGKTVNYSGNQKRSIQMSVQDSLKLQTDWIDILYLHWWDWTTSIEEVMDSLHILVEQGKVLYLGISDSGLCRKHLRTSSWQNSLYHLPRPIERPQAHGARDNPHGQVFRHGD